MNQALPQYNPPSFSEPTTRDYKAFYSAVVDFLQNRQAQYQIPFLESVINVINTGTQTFGDDLSITAGTAPYPMNSLVPTNWAHRVISSGTVNTIAVPNGFQSFIVLLSLNGFSYTSVGGNISNSGGVQAGHPALCIYDPIGLKWWILSA